MNNIVEWKLNECLDLVPYLNGKLVAYMAQPGSQTHFLRSSIFEVLYHGNRGGGKSLTLLMSFARHVGAGHGVAWKGIIFRRTFGELRDIIAASREWFPKVFPKASYNISDHTWRFATGETLVFGFMDKEDDYWNDHGQQCPVIAFEELTTWSNAGCYLKMFSCCRSSKKGVPIMIRSTTNPNGIGNSWVKERFNLSGFNPVSGPVIVDKETPTLARAAIKGMLHENKVLLNAQPNYAEVIRMSAGGNINTIKAWIDGSWDIASSGFFADAWDYDRHVIPKLAAKKLPSGWRLTRAFDHGTSNPFSVLWVAISDGEPINIKGKDIGDIRGDVIIFSEWYGADDKGKGLRMLSSSIAKGILNREKLLGISNRITTGVADSAIWTRNEDTSVAQQFRDSGVLWKKCAKGRGSRGSGWMQILELMDGAIPNEDGVRERKGLFITEECHELIKHLTTAPRDTTNPDDIDTDSDDHDLDALRYAIYVPKTSKITRNIRTQIF